MKLESDLSIRNAEVLFSTFEQAYSNGGDISLDASDVERIDTTIFQIISALKIRLQSENMSLHITEPSDEFIGSAELLGLADFLELTANQNG